MKAIITVVGKDTVGILSEVATLCANYNVNVEDVTQSILQDMFAMIMLVDISKLNGSFTDFAGDLKKLGEDLGLVIHAMHEDLFNSMHRV